MDTAFCFLPSDFLRLVPVDCTAGGVDLPLFGAWPIWK